MLQEVQDNEQSQINSKTQTSKYVDSKIKEINVGQYFCHKGYQENYLIAKKGNVSNTIEELLGFFKSRAYGLCWGVSEEKIFHAFEAFE